MLKPQSVYIIGSLRNPEIPKIGNALREAGHDVFDDWFAGGYEADDKWREYEKSLGRTYGEALNGYAAAHVFDFDYKHLSRCDTGVLVAPAGKSAHLELGWMIGMGKRGYVFFSQGEPERWDVMYKFAHGVFFDLPTMLQELKTVTKERKNET